MARLAEFNVHARVDGADATAALRRARTEVRRRERSAIRRAGEETILPKVRARMPGFVAGLARIRADRGGGYVTLMGVRRLKRAAGLLNFGGTRRDVIRPKNGGGLTVNGRVVKAVKGSRHFRARRDIEHGRDAGMPAFGQAMKRTVLEAFSDAGLGTS